MSQRSARFVLALGLLSLATPCLAQQSPEAELKNLRVPANLELSLYAAEPLVTNPAAIDIDSHGRVWVAEIEHYRAAAHSPPDDKIKVLEDTDGDGKADKVTVFADNLFCPMSLCVAGPRVYVATSPDLWVYEDLDGDLKADGPPKKLLTGLGGFNHDHGAHSLVLGPDHKWWMAHGDFGFKLTGVDGSQAESQWGAVLRGELDGSQLEVVAENFRNIYEVCIDSFGNAFVADNDNDGNESARICWLMDGGNYGWYGRPPGIKGSVPSWVPAAEHWHFRGHIPGNVPATKVTGFGAPCGMCFYEGHVLPAEYQNVPLLAEAGPREVRMHRHHKVGAGMTAEQTAIVTSDGDAYFRPDDVCVAPDGTVFVADWYDGAVGGHAYNNPDQGRIFRLTAKDGAQAAPTSKPGPYTTTDDALAALASPNLNTQFLAREKLLADGPAALAALKQTLDQGNEVVAARALWVIDRIGSDEARNIVLEQLKHASEERRTLAVRILRRYGEQYAPPLLALVDDPSLEVRRELLLGLSHWTGSEADAALVKLALTYDGKDRYLLEAINLAANTDARRAAIVTAIEGQGSSAVFQRLPLVQMLDADAAFEAFLESWKNDAHPDFNLLLVAAATQDSPKLMGLVLKMLDEANDLPVEQRQRGFDLLEKEVASSNSELRKSDQLATIVKKLLADNQGRPTALELIKAAALKSLGPEVLAIVNDPSAPLELREQAITTAADLQVDGATETFAKFLAADDKHLRSLALDALVDMQSWPAVKSMFLSPTAPELRNEALEKLLNSTGGSLVLLRWLDAGELKDDIKPAVIARAAKHPDANIRLLFEKYIPEDQRAERLGAAIKAEDILALTGDPKRGEQIFAQSSAAQCRSCHQVKGFGGTFGPDLTMIGKKYERGALLDTILDPSKAIAPEFVPYVIQTDEGLVYAGFILERNDQEIVLKDIKNKRIRIPVETIEVLDEQKKSMMPELILRDITAQDAADLLAYLQTLNQPFEKVAVPRR